MKIVGLALIAACVASAAAADPVGRAEWLAMPVAGRDAYLLGLYHGFLEYGPIARTFAVEDCLARNTITDITLPNLVAEWVPVGHIAPDTASMLLYVYLETLCGPAF